MLQDSGPAEAPIPLATSGVAPGDAGVAFPALRSLGLPFHLPWSGVRHGAQAGRRALGVIIVGTVLVVLVAVNAPTVLAPRSTMGFPGWLAGPLTAVVPGGLQNPTVVGIGFSVILLAMFAAYLVALGAVRTFSLRTLAVVVVGLHLMLLLGPPLQLNDVFNYLGYAHLGGLHHLNPYAHSIRQESFDPVYRFASWHNLRSPYGPLFTAITYPLALMPLPVSYWIYKVMAVLLSLGFIALIWRCARQLGRDPRYAVVLVALNPIYLMYEVGGFHNDFFMLVPMLGAISLLLAGRDRSAGAVVMLAVAVKFTAVILLPFLVLAAVTRPRRIRVIVGAVAGVLPLLALSLLLFGFTVPNLAEQSSLLTDFSIPNVVGLVIGAGGGAPWLLKLAGAGLVFVVAHQIFRQRNWLNGVGWATVALLASLGWLMPWYVVWLLPFAALSTSTGLRRVALGGTLFLIVSFMPATNLFMQARSINPLGGAAGSAAVSAQNKLEQ